MIVGAGFVLLFADSLTARIMVVADFVDMKWIPPPLSVFLQSTARTKGKVSLVEFSCMPSKHWDEAFCLCLLLASPRNFSKSMRTLGKEEKRICQHVSQRLALIGPETSFVQNLRFVILLYTQIHFLDTSPVWWLFG